MKTMVLVLAAGFGIAFGGSCVADPVRTEFEQSFIGREWNQRFVHEDAYPLSERCEYRGGSVMPMHDSFVIESFLCDGQQLELLGQIISPRKVLVLDAVLFPKLEKGERIMMSGDCELRRKIDKFFFAIVNLGKRDAVNWKTGVKAAWYPNPETGKIEKLSTRNIVCFRPTPP